MVAGLGEHRRSEQEAAAVIAGSIGAGEKPRARRTDQQQRVRAWSPASASTAEPNRKPPQSARRSGGAARGHVRSKPAGRNAEPRRRRCRCRRGHLLGGTGTTAACRDQEEQLEVLPD
jgi:hypothetical protein